jgi:WD40 repeat protein
MSATEKQDGTVKPLDNHATGTEDEVTTLDNHATDEKVVTLAAGSTDGTVKPLDNHATDEKA